ncbi:hypothetical protein C8Q79DRAFT_748421 [Trametes meyenii]|nr:hypothetical protein C8Q79DRAFT_748421 [Trametes meyenii]
MVDKWAEIGVDVFMERLVPGGDLPPQCLDKLPVYKLPVGENGEVFDSVDERKLYLPIVEGIRGTFKAIGCESLMAYQTDAHNDTVAPGSDEARDLNPYRADITIYPTTDVAKGAYKLPPKNRVSPRQGDDDDDAGHMDPPEVDWGTAVPHAPMTRGHGDASSSSQTPDQPVSALGVGVGDDASTEPIIARMSWVFAELLIEVKGNRQRGPFSAVVIESKDNGSPIPLGRERKLARGQTIHYGAELFNRQHRKHAFILSLVYDVARIIYLDRAAAIYSRAFNYLQDPTTLATFLYRFSKMSPEDRGHDPTVSLASKSEHILFRKLPRTYPSSAAARENPVPMSMLEHAVTQGWPVYAMNIYAQWNNAESASKSKSLPDDLPFASHRCLVGRPHRMSGSLTGRGTRGFVAYDLTEEKVVYIKDSWRAVSENINSEYDVYRRLYDRIKPEVLDCTLMYLSVRSGGDVCGPSERNDAHVDPAIGFQDTCTQVILEEEGGPIVPLMRRHHRLVFKEVCTPLEDFPSARLLVGILHRAIIGMYYAFTRLGQCWHLA